MMNFDQHHCCQTVWGKSMGKSSINISWICSCTCPLVQKWINVQISKIVEVLVVNKASIIQIFLSHQLRKLELIDNPTPLWIIWEVCPNRIATPSYEAVLLVSHSSVDSSQQW